ncbi:MAG: hypothetical protein IJV40_06250 [Oscillospiraceae bacterium]|nr:hypothetical protein [Oscillospiraceae bacterium]
MKRPMIPYGYKIENGAAIPHPEESEKLRRFFAFYLDGCSIRAAAKAAGIDHSPTTCRNMLTNETYLGTDFYPRLIQPDVMKKAKARAEVRGQNYSREREARYRVVPVRTAFTFAGATPDLSASRLYECIQPKK